MSDFIKKELIQLNNNHNKLILDNTHLIYIKGNTTNKHLLSNISYCKIRTYKISHISWIFFVISVNLLISYPLLKTINVEECIQTCNQNDGNIATTLLIIGMVLLIIGIITLFIKNQIRLLIKYNNKKISININKYNTDNINELVNTINTNI